MLDEIFNIEKFNIFSDHKYYYFFRALEELDIEGIKNKTITNQYGRITRLITDREFYGEEKYKADSEISLEEIVEHIKMHYNKHTNCISFSSNANVGLSYGRSDYEDSYVVLRIEKEKMQESVFNAPLYILSEITKKIEDLVNTKQIDQDKIKLYKKLQEITNQEDLDIFINDNMELIDNLRNIDMFFGGIDFSDDLGFTRSRKYNALDDEQNFYKNKIVTMIDLMGEENIIPSISNKFLIQTIGNAFASLEVIHYKDIDDKHLTQVSSEFMDVLSLVQQVPNMDNVDEIKKELIDYINGEKIELDKFKYNSYEIDENDYSIERMYNLTHGDIDYKTAMDTYKNMFYLTKSRLRTYKTLEWLKEITNNKEKYDEIYKYIENNCFGIEEEITTRLSNNNKKLSESVGFNFNNKELIDIINNYSEIVLEDIINDPLNALRLHIRELSYIEDKNVDKLEYFAKAIVDSYDFKKNLNIEKIYDEQKREIIDKLKEIDLLKYYEELKNLNLKEQDIINVILTNVIKGKNLEDIDVKEKFTISELEYFLEYSQIKEGEELKLREYQVPIVSNINRLHKSHRFAAAVTPTGSGKSFIALKIMLRYKDEEMLYIAPNNEILNQLTRYAKLYIHGKKNTSGKSNEKILKEVFPNLKLTTYQKLLEENSIETIKKKYKYIVLDEIHRSGAEKWIEKVKGLIDNQDDDTKILGISATPQRDTDYNDMSDYWAEYLGYTEEEILNKKHLACDIDLIEAIERGYITKPKVICCKYSYLKQCEEQIQNISNEEEREQFREEFELLRRNIAKSSGIEKILRDNLKSDGKYIVFLPVGDYEDIDGNKLEKNATKTIELYQNQMMQYVYAGSYVEKHIDKFNQIEKCINENIPFNNELVNWIEQEKDNLLLLAKMSITKNSNLLVTESNYLVENIIERMGYERLNETKQSELLRQKTKSLMESYSMLGEYGDKKNNSELSNFNSSNSKKTKFMFVMNKLNEGVHPDHIDGIIWLRPLDENSKILYLQQLGRCIHGLNNNEEQTEENQPIVLDLVNNTLNINYDKEELPEEKDLREIRNLTISLIDRGINDINEIKISFARNGVTFISKNDKDILGQLIRLNIKYKKYADNEYSDKDNYIDLDLKRKKVVKKIIYEGSKINLWNNEYDIETHRRRERENGSSGTLLDLFEIEQEIYDIINFKIRIDEYGYISPEEKKEELIKTIRELRRLPNQKGKNDKSEKVFRDGTNQRRYYDYLQNNYNKIDQTKGLSEKEIQVVNDYEEIREVLNEYIVEVPPEEKKDELIKTIRELGRLPNLKRSKNDESEKVFRDGTNQRNYYEMLQKKYNKLDQTKDLSEKEKQVINDYKEIRKVLNEYIVEVTSEEKKDELIKTIRELGRLPNQKGKNDESERVFKDGTDQRGFYNILQTKYYKIDQTKDLSEKEMQVINDYEEITKILNEYIVEVSSEEKKKEIIKTIRELRRLPNQKRSKNDESERVFRDGTDQRGYYDHLQTNYNKIDQTKDLSEKEMQVINDYEEITKILNEYIVEVSSEEKKEEIIKTIQELGRLPKVRSDHGNVSEKTFRDGTDQRGYYNNLKTKYNNIDQTKKLTEKEKQVINDYEEITKVLNEYIVEVPSEEKKDELIKTIRELGRLPNKKRSTESEKVFRDGTDQRGYYDHLRTNYNKIDQTKELTEKEKQVIKDYEEITKVLNEYIVEVFSEEKKEEIIKTIRELGRLPNLKRSKNDESERVFRDGTDQRKYYDHLKTNYNKIDQTKELTEKEIQVIKDYEEIAKVLNEYIVEVSSEEKKDELIKTIRELRRFPNRKRSKNDESEKVFRDGTDQRGYYQELQKKYNKIDQTKELSEKEIQVINDYEEINYIIGCIEAEKYYNMYGDLNVCIGYKAPKSKYPLREFLDRQRTIITKEEKTEYEINTINQLFNIYPDWVTGKPLDNDNNQNINDLFQESESTNDKKCGRPKR